MAEESRSTPAADPTRLYHPALGEGCVIFATEIRNDRFEYQGEGAPGHDEFRRPKEEVSRGVPQTRVIAAQI
jgi:hypothetical protein